MILTQSKMGNKTTFDFRDDFYIYSLKDGNGSISMNISYKDVWGSDLDLIQEKNIWFRNVGIAWFILGFTIMILGHKFSIWIILGIIFYVIYHIYQVSFVKIETFKADVFVIKDKNSDKIIEKLFQKRNAVFKAMHIKNMKQYHSMEEADVIKLLNDTKYLFSIEAITKSEADDFKKKLKSKLKKLKKEKSDR
jgi:hypothetical protein